MFMEVILVTQRRVFLRDGDSISTLLESYVPSVCIHVWKHVNSAQIGSLGDYEFSILDFRSRDSVGSISKGPLIWDNLFK